MFYTFDMDLDFEQELGMCSVSGDKCKYIYDSRRGEEVCCSCGRVGSQRGIENAPEWRLFEDSGVNAIRAEAINPYTQYFVTNLAPGNSAKYDDISRKLIKSSNCVKNRNINHTNERFSTFGDILKLHKSIVDDAKFTYHLIYSSSKNNMRGFKRDSIICAVLFYCCKKAGVPRTLKEIQSSTHIDEQSIKKCYIYIMKQNPSLHIRQTNADELVGRFCSKLGLDFQVIKVSKQISGSAVRYVEGRLPSSIAAASIYITCKHILNTNYNIRTEKAIATAAEISTSTLKIVYSTLVNHLESLVSTIRY